jgi:predicted nucleic acid-binding Zn ribbon protein
MEPISNILFSLYRGTPKHDEWVLACLQGAWPGIVGSRIAKVCHPASFSNHSLRVEVTDGSWQQPLEEMREQLLAKIQGGSNGEVQQLEICSRQPAVGSKQ